MADASRSFLYINIYGEYVHAFVLSSRLIVSRTMTVQTCTYLQSVCKRLAIATTMTMTTMIGRGKSGVGQHRNEWLRKGKVLAIECHAVPSFWLTMVLHHVFLCLASLAALPPPLPPDCVYSYFGVFVCSDRRIRSSECQGR